MRTALRDELTALERELRQSEETVARIESGSAAEAPTMAPADQATMDQGPGSTDKAPEPSLPRVRYFGDYELLERSPAAAWAWSTAPARSA